MSNLVTRFISGIVYITIFLFTTLFSKESFIGLITIFGLLAVYEFNKMIQLKSIIPYLLLVLLAYFIYTQPNIELIWVLLGLTLICGIRLLFYLYSNKEIYPTHNFEKLDLAVRYIVFSFLFILLIPLTKKNYNPNIIIGILIIIWTNDSFAYLVGKNFGKNKLFEKISPKKTIEGFIGGLVFAIIAGVIISKYFTQYSLLSWVIIALITAVFGTFGDLIESKFKRRANIKDSGNIMPGHGGILDRLDSLLFAAPFVYLYIHYLI